MSVLALDLALVRDILLPGLTLSPGRAMMARVVSADEGSGGALADPGPPLAQAQAQAGELRDALARACERPASVTVSARRRPLDLYA